MYRPTMCQSFAASIYFSILLCLSSVISIMAHSSPRILLMLDVDNTLYKDSDVGIESQIVTNTHRYCQKVLGLSADQADELYREYGSTVEGLKETLWKDLSGEDLQSQLDAFYHNVYDTIDMSELLSVHLSGESSTGYSHAKDQKLLCRLLCSTSLPICFASNSPSWHVANVLEAMGLAKPLSHAHLFTPDRQPSFPTKNTPDAFFSAGSSSNDLQLDTYDRILLFEDSGHNIERVCGKFRNVEGIRISNDNSLADALLRSLGLVDPEYEFDQVNYLKTKNVVDRKAMDVATWNRVIQEMQKIEIEDDGPIRIVDVGAGLLSMLDLFLHGDTELGFHPLTDRRIHYVAYESNRALYKKCHELLLSWGFALKQKVSADIFVYYKSNFEVRFILEDFGSSRAMSQPPHLVVGCCFADLLEPTQLVPSLMRSFRLLETDNTLLYFPITFCGITQFLPPKPFETTSGKASIPSDTLAFRLYSKALTETLGHNLDPLRLQQTMEDHGMLLLRKSSSDWKIDPEQSPYLFDTMLYFFGTAGGPQLLEEGWDAPGWISRSRERRPKIQVSNVDLLFRAGKKMEGGDQPQCSREESIQEILFTDPRKVTSIEKSIPELGPNQVLIQTSHSLISSGTELKIFKGMFDDAALDVNIKGMEDERMAYPLAYGYCLVGYIVKGGSGVPPDYIGKLAFSFAPHASHVVADLDGIRLVPDGISPIDAIFMPSVETALSMTHDAHHRVGENIAVYGQGLIGLLVTAILQLHNKSPFSGKFGTITVFDTIPDRLAAASLMGASQALLPGGTSGPFDVTIEVSGNGRALQSAIDQTSNGGRVIVGSWYGNSKVDLLLGIDFHRSHKTIQTSQVSEIPAKLQGLWSKSRRFDLTWELVRQIRPSRLLTKTTTLENAQKAYEALESGTEIAVAFEYK